MSEVALKSRKPPGKGTERAARKRDAAATRQAILDAARGAFGSAGYDQVGLREIAGAAGVDVALVARYFGSKEQLFAAAVYEPSPPPLHLPEDRRAFGEWLANRLLDQTQAYDLVRLLALHHSVGNPAASAIVRKITFERFIRPVGAWLGGDDGELRASLAISHLAGFRMMRHLVGIEPLATADRKRIVALLAPALQVYADS